MKLKRIFYIDYENVTSNGFNGCENLTKQDKIIIFAGGGADGIGRDAAKILLYTKAKIEIINVQVGMKDALDFQLVTHISNQCKKKNVYYILSKDKGYDFAVYMLNRLGYCNINRCESVASALHFDIGTSSVSDKSTVTADKEKTDSKPEKAMIKPKAKKEKFIDMIPFLTDIFVVRYTVFKTNEQLMDFSKFVFDTLKICCKSKNMKSEFFRLLRIKYKDMFIHKAFNEAYNYMKKNYDSLLKVFDKACKS